MTTTPGGLTVTAVSAGTASAQAVGANPRRYLMISNESASASVAFAFGASATAALNTGGSITLGPAPGPGSAYEYKYPSLVPDDAIQMIASAASTPVTIIEAEP